MFFLSSVNHSRKLITSKENLWNLQSIARSTGNKLDSQLASEMWWYGVSGGSLVRLNP